MTYRDNFETCPRCAIALIDARSARGCSGCGGLWLAEEILAEMVQRMLPPGPLQRLELAVLERDEPTLACPACGEAMEPTTIHQVPIDRCPKAHGVWFDASELETALRRVGEAARSGAPRPAVARAVPAATGPVVVTLTVARSGRAPVELPLHDHIIKIGSIRSAHVRLDGEDVSRMHAIIEVDNGRITIIDLGSATGTYVNGKRVNKATIGPDDAIGISDTTIRVSI